MRRRLAFLLLALLLALPLCGCGERAGAGRSVSVYRVLRAEYRRSGELLRPESVTCERGALGVVISALQQTPTDPELDRSMPKGVSILSYSLLSGVLTLDMSREFLALEGMDRTLAECCAALSLCSLEGVESVSICVGDQLVSTGLNEDSVLLSDEPPAPYEKRVRLFFLSNDGRFLTPEYHGIAVGDNVLTERVVMEELLRGPYDDGLASAVPEGTALLSVGTSAGVCTVDLSEQFLSGRPLSAAGARLAVYAVVNSLTSLAGVDSVRILVDGEAPEDYPHIPLNEALPRCESVVGPANGSLGEAQVSIWITPEDGDEPVELPVIVTNAGDYSSEAALALAALMEFESEPGYRDLFPDGAVWLNVAVVNRSCAVDLPDTFFESHGAAELEQAVASITATLTALSEIDDVVILRDGKLIR